MPGPFTLKPQSNGLLVLWPLLSGLLHLVQRGADWAPGHIPPDISLSQTIPPPFLQRDAVHSADYAVAICLSIRLSVCHTPVFCRNGYTYPQTFYSVG